MTSHGPPAGGGAVDPRTATPTHQHTGAPGSPPGAPALSAASGQPFCGHHDGQLHSGCPDLQPGRDSLETTSPPNCATAIVGRQSQRPPAPQTHSGSSKCSGRPVVPSASGSEHRVDTCPTSSDPPMASVGSTTRGHVCHSQQRQTTRVCLSTSGPPGMEGRRLLLSLGEPGYVSVPTDATHRRSPASHSIGQLPCHPDCPSLADPVLVPTTAVSGRRSPKTPSDNSHPPSPAAHGPVSSGPATSSSSRVATIQSALERRGYSASVAGRIASSHRQSTQVVYDSKWRIFSEWCQDANLDPFSTTTPILTEFLTHLFTVKNFAPVTIAGYRTTVLNTLEKVTGSRPCDEHLITSLLNQFEVERPRPTRSTPTWDLALVLHALHGPPFEPLAQAPLWALTYKSVFPDCSGYS